MPVLQKATIEEGHVEPHPAIDAIQVVQKTVPVRPEADHSSEESYRTIFELAGDAMFVHDIESGAILDANVKACELHGCTLAELKSLGVGGISDGSPPYDMEHAYAYIRKAVEGEPQRFEWLIRRKNGERFWVDVSLNRVRILGDERILASVRSIDERKKAQDALRKAHDELEARVAERTSTIEHRTAELEQAEQRFRAIVEASPTPLLLSRVSDGLIMFANERLERLLCVPPGQLVGRRTPEFYHDPADRARILALMAETGNVRDVELRIKRSDGVSRWVSASLHSLVFDGERALATSFLDITERKQSEQMLRDREEHFRSLIENASDIIAVVDVDGTLRYVSPATERILGYPAKTRIGRPSDELLHEEDALVLRSIYEDIRKRPTETRSFEFRFLHRDGSWHVLEGILTGMIAEGEMAGIIINARDITKRKQAEDTLHLQKALLEAQSDSLIDGVLVVDQYGEILSYNRQFVDMFGIATDALERRSDDAAIASVLDKVEDPQAFVDRISYLYAHPQERAREEIAMRDGRVLDRYSAPVVGSEGVYYGRIWFFRDITDQKRHSLELERARHEAEVAREEADQLAKSLHRELEAGRQIQQGFLPSQLPQPAGWETAFRFKPAWQVAGDFYDVFSIGPNLIGLLIADVCGKGVGAALFMALFHSLLRTSAERTSTTFEGRPDARVRILKNSIVATNEYVNRVHRPSHIFASVFFGLLDPDSGELTYINAGHEPPMLANAQHEVIRLHPTGPAVGLNPDVTFGVAMAVIAPGGLLLAYTDGVTEARNAKREFFSEERLIDLVTRPVESASAALEEIERSVCDFASTTTPADDVTLLAVRRK